MAAMEVILAAVRLAAIMAEAKAETLMSHMMRHMHGAENQQRFMAPEAVAADTQKAAAAQRIKASAAPVTRASSTSEYRHKEGKK